MRSDLEFGEVESLRIDVLSETGWFDDAEFKRTMAAHGGSGESQYRIPWRSENAGGYAALITAILPGGDVKRILLDTGWNNAGYWVYTRHGIDAMLAQGQVDLLVLSHWHLDHFWAIEFDAQTYAGAADNCARYLAWRRTGLCCARALRSALRTAKAASLRCA